MLGSFLTGGKLMEKEMQYYLADVSELIPYVRNARTHSEAQVSQIAASIREFGFLSPILVAEDNTILAGHGRLAAALKLGLKKVPCVKENHLTETQKRAYIIADNKLSLNAGWDNELLAVELSELEGADFNLDLLGFDEAELSSIFDADKDVNDDDFDVEKELEEPCFSKTGDMWTLGKHRIICGDATKLETYKTLLENTKVNLVVTDPPYNVNYEGAAGKIKNDNMENDKFYQFLFNSFVNMEQAMADDASIYVFHADTEGLNFRKAFQDAGFYLSGCCIWKKPSLVLGRSPYQWQHEPCLYGWKKKGKHKWYAGRKETSVWEFEKPKKNADHPTMKPIALLAYPIKNSSMTNSLVLDPFAGSGSTLIACEQTGRICYAIELDEKYCDVIVKRYIEQVGNDKSVKVLRGGKEYSFTEVFTNK
ncbi:DNA methylase N-4/N-6 domain-containing protein [Gardnerella vaginalis 5-1]|nr:DNA methylase N-4/N-6 domain-containing protein [Gardnerella vaginalis 5-1]